MLVDLEGEEADHILVDVRLALELGDRRGRRVDVEHHVVRLAVLRDSIGEGAQTPGLGLGDLPAIVGDDLGGVFRERIDLGLGEVLTREENMLVERHVSFSLFWPIADAPQWHVPPAVFSKQTSAKAKPSRQRRAYGGRAPKRQPDP